MQKVIETLLIGLSTGSIYALMSLALVLVWRSTRVVNFAQAGQAMLSTYIGFEIASRSEIFWLGLVFAIAAGALVGAGVDYFFMRVLFKHATSGPAAVVAPVIATLGLLGLIRSIVGLTWGGEFKSIEAPASFRWIYCWRWHDSVFKPRCTNNCNGFNNSDCSCLYFPAH